MNIAIFIIWFTAFHLSAQQGGPPSLPNGEVVSIVLMEDGKQDGINYVETNFQLSGNENSEDGFTLCFWLFPYRYHQSDSIITLSFMGRNALSVGMVGGELVVRVQNFADRYNINPQYRQWNYYCFLLNENVNIYGGGAVNQTNNATLPSLYPYGNKQDISCTLGVGGRGVTETSMSGEVADIRFYARYLSPQKLDSYKIITSSITDYHSFSMPPPTMMMNTAVTIKTYILDDLNQEHEPYFVMDFEITSTFGDANNTCKKYKSRLPDVEDGELRLVNLFKTYSSETQIDISQFWMTNKSNNGCVLASISSGSVDMTNASCVSQTLSQFGCITLKVFKLKLLSAIGSQQKTAFYPIPFKNGIFENNETRILAASGTIQLIKISTQEVLGNAFADDLSLIIGRHDFYDNSHNLIGQITLSACEDNEFTCTNGNCIGITKACDFQNDCGDNSDESIICQPFMKLKGLSDFIRADNPTSNGTLPLDLSLIVYQILDVNLKDGKIQYFLDMTVQWIDRRLTSKFLYFDYVNYLPQDVANKYWQPKITASETLEDADNFNLFKNPGVYTVKPFNNGTIDVYESYEALLFDGKDVTEIHRKQSKISIECNMDLFYYPMDTQRCCMNLSLYSIVGKPDSSWNPNTSKASMNQNINLALYDITNFTHAVGDDLQTFGFCITLHRKSGGFMFNTFLPCILVEIIGLMTNLFPVHAYENRVGVTLSCMFVVAALFMQGSTELPESAEPRMIDIWIFMNIIVLFFVFTGHVIVIYYHNNSTNMETEKGDKNWNDTYDKFEDIPVERMIDQCGQAKSAWVATGTAGTLKTPNNLESKKPEKLNKIGAIFCVTLYTMFVFIYMSLSYIR